MQTYLDLKSKSWAEVVQMNERQWRAPFSVHLPIHPPHARTFVYMDCAGNAYTLPTPPDVRTFMPGRAELLAGIETMVVHFAFNTPAFVPDFRLAQIELADQRWPLPKWSYDAWKMHYEIEYCCARMDDTQNAVWIKCSVTNEDTKSRDAHVRVKVAFHREKELFDYHYVPFYWDAGKWQGGHPVQLAENGILKRDARFLGFIQSNDFDLAWERNIHFSDDEYKRPYFVQPCLRLKEAQGLLHFSGALAPGETKSFVLALLTEPGADTNAHVASLRADTFAKARQRTMEEFQSLFPPERAELIMPQNDMDKAFTAVQVANYQMLIDFKNGKGLQPCQGGSSERFYVWVWEAMCMLLPMLQLGHFEPVRRALDFIFSLQDGDCPPEGNFTSLAGAVGTTSGSRWMNSTGAALALAAEYYRYSHDAKFLQEYQDKLLRAAFWIIGEIRATRKLNPDGSRPPVYGLMPFGNATDGDVGYVVAHSDSYLYFGLEKFSRVLASINHPQAGEVAAEVAQYREDLDWAINYMRRDDGFIDRKIVLGDDKSVTVHGFNNTCGAQTFAYTGVLSAQDLRFLEFTKYAERNMMYGFFGGFMSRDEIYIGTSEYLWQYAYLCMGCWKHAYAALQTNLKYGMSADAFLTQERFSPFDPAFTPWQPNSSGNGRLLEMIVRQFYFEYRDLKHGETTVFFGGMPPGWFAIHSQMALRGLYTPEGRISIETSGWDFAVTCAGFTLCDKIIRIPEYFKVEFIGAEVDSLGGGFYKITHETSKLTGKLAPRKPPTRRASKRG